jgi:hypothetical protein
MVHPIYESCSSLILADAGVGHPKLLSFLNVNNLFYVLAWASILIMLNEISLVHQIHL